MVGMSACFSVKKENGVLQFKDFKNNCENRNPSTILMLYMANTIYNWPDFEEILVQTDDVYFPVQFEGITKYCAYNKEDTYEGVVPDFTFHQWPNSRSDDYHETVFEIAKAGMKPPELIKVGWIGQFSQKRELFFYIGKEAPFLFDIFDSKTTPFISLPELTKYALLIDIEGAGYSGRLKYLLWSHRPVLLIDRPYKEYFFEYLVPWEHYIPVKRDLSDLLEKTFWCLENYEKALNIGRNAFNFARKYLTREACFKQWDAVITGKKAEF